MYDILSTIVVLIVYAVAGSIGGLWIVVMVLILLWALYDVYRLFTRDLSVATFIMYIILKLALLLAAYSEYMGQTSLTKIVRNQYRAAFVKQAVSK